MDKTAYVAPPLAELTVTIIRDANPTIVLTLDVGMPNWLPHFELKIPLPDGKASAAAKVTREALGVLLDEVMAFMQSMEYSDESQIELYSKALQCFESITPEAESERAYPDYIKDTTVKTYDGTFPMPQTFVDQTQLHVVTASEHKSYKTQDTIRRVPDVRRIQLTKLPPPKTTPDDVGKLVRLYKGRTLVTQPHRLYIMVYDQFGKPAGVIPQSKWKSTLLGSTISEKE